MNGTKAIEKEEEVSLISFIGMLNSPGQRSIIGRIEVNDSVVKFLTYFRSFTIDYHRENT